jgi:hypothetical protein
MSSNRVCTILAALMLCVFGQASYADDASDLYHCPDSIDLNGQELLLTGASVFDTFPSLRELVPDVIGNVHGWTIDETIDPFLVCRYTDVKHLRVIHVKGAKSCEVGFHPVSAKCSSVAGVR